jgi:hypothetical protein
MELVCYHRTLAFHFLFLILPFPAVTNYRDEGQAQVPDLSQDPVQSGLVLDRTSDEGLAVPHGGQRQPLKPRIPVAIQLASDTNFINSALTRHGYHRQRKESV